jgi:hypothetical protein
MRLPVLLAVVMSAVALGGALAQGTSSSGGGTSSTGGAGPTAPVGRSASTTNPASPAIPSANPGSGRPETVTPPIASPGSEASNGRKAAGTASREFPNNPRLEAESRKLDRQIKRGICVGC